ncbi:phage minor capsid protein [Thermocatellispora tengchongensis]|uniref:phage minor capsid protein n=1 Tax=Thermocatellispora tengchongensis TaxID=1073253 RepID=UPI00363A5493
MLDTWAEGMDAAVRGAVLQVADVKLRKRLERVLQDAKNLGAKQGISAGQGVAELAAQAVRLVTSVREGALRAVDDIYRNVIAETAGRVLVGAETRREAAQRALDRLTAEGIKGFTDSADPPRTWTMASYVEMAMRTATARAAVDGHLSTLRDAGINLVSVSRLPYTCDRCARWEGEVLALSGTAGTRVEENPATGAQVFVQVAGTVAEARLAGLLHPNCGHSLNAYLPGVSRPAPVVRTDTTYKDSQRQRYLERKVRQHKRRAAVALDDDARAKADAKVAAYEGQLSELTAGADLQRKLQAARRRAAAARDEDARAKAEKKVAEYEQQLRVLPKVTSLRRKKSREQADAPPRDLEKLTDKQLAEQASKFAHDEEVLARLEQEVKRRDEAAETARKAAGPAAQDDPIAALSETSDIGELTDDHLTALMERYRDDDEGMARVLDELDRIERQSRQREDWSWNWREEETDADRQISDLIASGRYSYMEAYAEVHGLDPAELERQERRAMLEADRRPGEDIDQTVRRLYAEWLDQMYERAEQATNGFMLNGEGKAAGINERSLFSGPASRARKYASEELLRFWQDTPRLTLTEFRAQWLGRESDRRAAAQVRAGGAGRSSAYDHLRDRPQGRHHVRPPGRRARHAGHRLPVPGAGR